jgi:hypothetical protein
MATLADMRSRIQDDIDDPNLASQIDAAIKRSIRYYSTQRFWFNTKTITFTTVSGTATYGTAQSFPSDVIDIDAVKATVSGNDFIMPRMTYQEFLELDTGNINGQPDTYAIYDESMYIFPTPDATYTISMSYHHEFDELASDADSNDFTNNVRDLIEARAEWDIYSRIIKDQESANVMKQMEFDLLGEARAKTDKFISTGIVRPMERY